MKGKMRHKEKKQETEKMF